MACPPSPSSIRSQLHCRASSRRLVHPQQQAGPTFPPAVLPYRGQPQDQPKQYLLGPWDARGDFLGFTDGDCGGLATFLLPLQALPDQIRSRHQALSAAACTRPLAFFNTYDPCIEGQSMSAYTSIFTSHSCQLLRMHIYVGSYRALLVSGGEDIYPRRLQDRLSLDGANGGLDGRSSATLARATTKSWMSFSFTSVWGKNGRLGLNQRRLGLTWVAVVMAIHRLPRPGYLIPSSSSSHQYPRHRHNSHHIIHYPDIALCRTTPSAPQAGQQVVRASTIQLSRYSTQ